MASGNLEAMMVCKYNDKFTDYTNPTIQKYETIIDLQPVFDSCYKSDNSTIPVINTGYLSNTGCTTNCTFSTVYENTIDSFSIKDLIKHRWVISATVGTNIFFYKVSSD